MWMPLLWLGLAVGILGVSLLGRALEQEFLFCHFRRWLGYPCPICGGTRLVLALLSGDIRQAWLLNPLVFVVLWILLVVMAIRVASGYQLVVHISTRAWFWIGMAGMGLLVANWVYVIGTDNGACWLEPQPAVESTLGQRAGEPTAKSVSRP